MNNKSAVFLVVSILAAIGGIVVAAPTWESLASPNAVGGFCIALSGAIAAAFGVKPGAQS